MRDPIPEAEWVIILDGDSDVVELELDRFPLPLPKVNGSRYTAAATWGDDIDIDWWGEASADYRDGTERGRQTSPAL
jgi:hypothetical protein